MAIDIENEQHLFLGDAPKFIPGRPDKSTVYRWAMRPMNRLETFRVGGRLFTTREAIARFISNCNEPGAVAVSMTAHRVARQRAAGVTLDEAGIK